MTKRMSEDELLSFLEAEQSEAFQYTDGDVARARNQAMRDYLRFPYGTEQDGRSQVVSSDVFDTVEGILPDLVEVFVSSDKAVVFDPVGPEDEEGAKQATDACNHVFYKQNNGFLILYTSAKDALLLRTGGVKWFWDVRRTPKFETFSGDEMQIAAHLASNPKAEVLSTEELEPEPLPDEVQAIIEQVQPLADLGDEAAQAYIAELLPRPRYKVRLKTIEQKGQVRVVPIPAYELEVSARHNSVLLDDCPYVAHKSLKTLSDIQQMGFDVTEDDVKAARDETTSQDREFYDTVRGEDIARESNDLDPAMARGWIREEYVLCDFDGDGVAERRKVIRLGKKILENEEFSHVPIAAWTPYILTHKFDGLSVQDLTTDIQRITTEILRAQLDNLALANNQETVVLTDAMGAPKANIDDLLNRRPGGVLRESVPNAVRPYVERWQGIEAMPMVEMVSQIKEKRTGYSPVVAGLDADALNKTATEVSKQTNERQKRMKLMARIMAECMVKPMFRGIFKTLTDYCMEKLSFRLNGTFVQYDPQEWTDGYDMSVNVGIGTGDTMQQTMFLSQIAQMQGSIAASPFGPMLIDAEKIYNVQARLAELAGFKNPGDFWNAPPKDPQTGKVAQPQSGPPPELLKEQMKGQVTLQVEQARNEADLQKKRADLEVQAANDARDAEREERRFLMEQQLEQARIEAEERKHMREIEYRMWEAQLKSATTLQSAVVSAEASVANAATKAAEAEVGREVQ
jgi:hypothetical protein